MTTKTKQHFVMSDLKYQDILLQQNACFGRLVTKSASM